MGLTYGFLPRLYKNKKIKTMQVVLNDQSSFRVYIKAKDCLLKEFETRFDTLSYEIERSLKVN